MKKFICVALVCMIICTIFSSVVFAQESDKITATFLYVATDGSDAATGAIDAPFATINAAVKAARAIEGMVVINIKGGEYAVSETVELTAADNNLVIRAVPGEKVTLTGGKKIKYEDFSAETDEQLLKRIVTAGARSKIISADLKGLGIENLGENKVSGMGLKCDYAPTLTYNDRYLTIAQYPNGKDYIYTGNILVDGTKSEKNDVTKGYEIVYTVKDSRYKNWNDASDIWALGWYLHDWAESMTPVKIDFEKGTFTAETHYAGIVPDRRVKFFNLLEEIDEPGEYYIDRESGKLYMIAPDGFKAGEYLVFSSLDKDIITLEGCENITIQGIRFEGTTERGIYGTECRKCIVNDCEFTAMGKMAVGFEKDSRDCVVKNSYIHDVSAAGISLMGGNEETLEPGNNAAENCHIERFMQYKQTYADAVHMEGVANKISHCEINDAPHQAIRYKGQFNVIEYCDIYRVCTDTSDAGAIYAGTDWTDRKNEIRHNYFHDLKMIDTTAGMEMQAVYLDDMHASTAVYGNVFYKCDSVALYGGGRDNTFENNLMLECKKPFRFDARGTTWMTKDGSSQGKNLYSFLNSSAWQTEIWKETFPELAIVLENKPEEPVGNTIRNNLIYGTPAMEIDPLVGENGIVELPVDVKTSDFVSFGSDFRIKEDSKVFEKLPDFNQIEFEKMGRYEYTVEDIYEDAGTVVPSAPADDKIKVVLNGTAIDFADVAPMIINDRTMVPLRAIFEALGSTVEWDDATKTVTAVKEDVTIRMTIGAGEFTRNEETVVLDSPATIVDSRTLVPVRAIAESFGSEVGWIAETKTVEITD